MRSSVCKTGSGPSSRLSFFLSLFLFREGFISFSLCLSPPLFSLSIHLSFPPNNSFCVFVSTSLSSFLLFKYSSINLYSLLIHFAFKSLFLPIPLSFYLFLSFFPLRSFHTLSHSLFFPHPHPLVYIHTYPCVSSPGGDLYNTLI